jgi:hypothetical protein
MGVVPGWLSQCGANELLAKIAAAVAVGLLIRSGDGDLFGQTAAQGAGTGRGGPCRRAAADRGAARLIIAAASR